MLGKLLKYEIKATGRIFLPLFLSFLVFAGITKIIYTLGPHKWVAPATISMAVYVIIMIGTFVMTFIMMIQRFYKNLLADEGYLTLTLPVKQWQHIVSKLLVSMLWVIASGIIAFTSLIIVSLQKGAMASLIQAYATFHNQFLDRFGASAYLWSLEGIVAALLSLASGILLVYASIAVGHLFSQHKILASFGAFIALNTLSQIIFTLISLAPGLIFFPHIQINTNNFADFQSAIQLVFGFGIIITGLFCAAYFALTNFILSKRLNLE